MGDVVNLGKFRKARKRAADQARADENAIRHGRTREQRDAEAAAQQRQIDAVDGAKRDRPDPDASNDEPG